MSATLERALALDATSAIGWRALAHVEERRGAWAKVRARAVIKIVSPRAALAASPVAPQAQREVASARVRLRNGAPSIPDV